MPAAAEPPEGPPLAYRLAAVYWIGSAAFVVLTETILNKPRVPGPYYAAILWSVIYITWFIYGSAVYVAIGMLLDLKWARDAAAVLARLGIVGNALMLIVGAVKSSHPSALRIGEVVLSLVMSIFTLYVVRAYERALSERS